MVQKSERRWDPIDEDKDQIKEQSGPYGFMSSEMRSLLFNFYAIWKTAQFGLTLKSSSAAVGFSAK